MTTQEVLVVDNEYPTREMIASYLGRAGFAVREATDVPSAQARLVERQPQLVLIDWTLPGINGLELIRSLRADRRTRRLPVILLTARGSEEDKLAGFDCGVDDYVTKPFSLRELVARIRTLLRRPALDSADQMIRIDGLTLDRASHRVSFGDDSLTSRGLNLGPTEYRLLELFMMSPGRAYTRQQLMEGAWRANVYVEERTIDVHIGRLRTVLEEVGCKHLVQTLRGLGYRFLGR
jgi:two-component system phosphate regulon response regulator PhoB